jgi:hypothetical protein
MFVIMWLHIKFDIVLEMNDPSQKHRAAKKLAAPAKMLKLPVVDPAPLMKPDGDGEEELVRAVVLANTIVKLAQVRRLALLL